MDWFKDDGIFLPMINDTGRNIFYKNCIESVAKGKVICDIGTGTGFLSVIAVRAGADKVISVEKDATRYQFAKETFKKIGINNKIELIHDDFNNLDIDADFYVSETIGNWLFDEKILDIFDHVSTKKGVTLPEKFSLQVVAYNEHPIFPVVSVDSEAYEFQPDIEIDNNFKNIINQSFQAQYHTAIQRHKSNMICNFFQQYKKMTDLKLVELYRSNELLIHTKSLTKEIRIVIPKGSIQSNYGARLCIFWKAIFGNFVMDVTDTIWCVPSKYIHNVNQDIIVQYDFEKNYWMFEYDTYQE